MPFDNGPRPQKSSGRKRQTVANLASKQKSMPSILDKSKGAKPSDAQQGWAFSPERAKAAAAAKKVAGQAQKPQEEVGLLERITPSLSAFVGAKDSALPAGSSNNIRRQLFQAFIKQGRPDLARVVKSRAFNEWVARYAQRMSEDATS